MCLHFGGASPNVNDLLCAFDDEHHLWCLVGAWKLDALGPASDRVGMWLERWSRLTQSVFLSVRKNMYQDPPIAWSGVGGIIVWDRFFPLLIQ